ncbi:MAG: DUF2147 domain-containing protein [Rhodoferax sp.]|uniref:DUF2147 domain-containing protein n=1 Tax=Rhodoferax sp. TaxID=50421 RepID=UPI002721BABD|nr:DUF2147 domain-containing protein [Rhodoferax sp.]MDO8450254.1 DUF2147 domain-containing protein [Rhodoferax sp.]
MYKSIVAIAFGALALPVLAQMTPAGVWRTIDDKTGEPSSEVRITDNAGVLSGRIEKLLRKDSKQDAVCDKCTDERKDKPVIGMEIIRGAKKADGKDAWEGGKILDPDNGKEYTLRLTPIEGGKKLEVRGYIAFFFRTQTWIRAQ